MTEPTESEVPLRIAALHQQAVAAADVRRPGGGTPWEDRGGLGLVGAFAKTVIGGIVSPVKLLQSIRRLDAMTDAAPLVILYGLFWAISAIVHAWIVLTQYRSDHTLQVDDNAFLARGRNFRGHHRRRLHRHRPRRGLDHGTADGHGHQTKTSPGHVFQHRRILPRAKPDRAIADRRTDVGR